MLTVNIHEVAKAAKGELFIIAKAGKPMVKVVSLDTPVTGQVRRMDFMAGRIPVPDDFDRVGSVEIERLFGALASIRKV